MTLQQFRRRTHQVLESGLGHDATAVAVNVGLLAAVVGNELLVIVGSVPRIAHQFAGALSISAFAAAAIFTAEYVLRLWAAVELPFLSTRPAWRARWAYAVRPMAIVDLLTMVCVVAGALFPDQAWLQALRLVAFLKVARYSTGLQSLGLVLTEERSALFGSFLVVLCLLFFTGGGIWLLEREHQPDRFGTLPDTLWWALITLATVGYGDVVPVTALGKLFTMFTVLVGIAVFALPVGIIVTGFTQIVARRDFMVTWALVARVPVFAGLDAAAIAEIMDLLHSHTYDPGEEIVRAGEPALSMYFIAQGDVIVGAGPRDVRLGIGEFFGEMALLEGRDHQRSVTALTHCRLLVLRREDFNRLGRLYPEMLSRVRSMAELRKSGAPTTPPSA